MSKKVIYFTSAKDRSWGEVQSLLERIFPNASMTKLVDIARISDDIETEMMGRDRKRGALDSYMLDQNKVKRLGWLGVTMYLKDCLEQLDEIDERIRELIGQLREVEDDDAIIPGVQYPHVFASNRCYRFSPSPDSERQYYEYESNIVFIPAVELPYFE